MVDYLLNHFMLLYSDVVWYLMYTHYKKLEEMCFCYSRNVGKKMVLTYLIFKISIHLNFNLLLTKKPTVFKASAFEDGDNKLCNFLGKPNGRN